jgi:phage/plasmid-like protein (TIGR03299 family)
MIVRTNPVTGKPDKLGMAGNWFQPIQNEAHADFFNALVDGGAGFDTAGSLYNGRNVFITMKLPASVEIAGVDRVDLYVVVINHHDGHGSFTVLITPIRVVCANTQSMALANNERMIKIRHTESATANVAEAQKALGLSYRFMETFQAEAERMITETLTKGQFEEIIGRVFGEPGPSKMAQTSRRNLTGDLMTLFSEAPTQEIGRGTRWAGLQAITEWADYQMPVRGADDHDVARAARSLLGDADKYKQRAFDLLRVPA